MSRINLICLGVRNIAAARVFYEKVLGFQTPNTEENPQIVFFNNGGTKLELYPLEGLLKDINEDNPPEYRGGFSGITLAYNTKTKEEVDEVLGRVGSLGGKVVKGPGLASWGGYHGYFEDLDGYHWEVAYSEYWKFDKNDMLIIN